MRLVLWTDEDGWKHRSWVRDIDSDDMAKQGILQDPPSLEGLDWQAIKRDLHNALMDAGLFTFQDLERGSAGNRLMGAILSATRTKVIRLYREAEKDG